MLRLLRSVATIGLATGLMSSVLPAQTLQILSAEGDPNSVAAIKWAAAEFKKTHPGVDIEYQTVSFTEIGQKIIAATAAGSPPDIVHLDDFGASVLSAQGMLDPAGDVVDSIGKSDYFPIPLKAVTFSDKVWGVPFSNGFNLLWYRKDLYEKNGLKPPKTWGELLENVKKLHGNLPDVGQMYGIALALNNSNHTNDTIQNFMWSNGASVLDKDGKLAIGSPEAVEAYKYMAELFKYAPPGVAQYGNLEVMNAFATGKVAHTNYPARIVLQIIRTNPKLADSVGVVLIPKGPSPKARYAATLYSKAWGFPKGAKNTAVAKEFVKFLETGEREVRWLNSVPVHYWPPRKSTAASPEYNNNEIIQSPLGKMTAAFIVSDALPAAQPQLTEAGTVNTQSFKVLQAHVLAKLMQKVVLGNIPLDKAVSDGVADSKQLLSR
jgi:multiple sugar transport system substrate-binding protein